MTKQNKLPSSRLEDKSPERIAAEVGLSPVFSNSQTASLFADDVLSEKIPRGEAISVMVSTVDKVSAGDLRNCEATLVAQAITLDAMFNSLARKAASQMDANMQAVETCLRLALKAQGQCRATLQTLAEIKNPRPLAIVKQANIAHGHQQINNETPSPKRARRPKSVKQTIGTGNHESRLDTGAASTPSGIDPQLETLEAVDWPSDT